MSRWLDSFAQISSLFSHLGVETSQRALQQLLTAVATLDDDASVVAVQSLSQTFFEQGTSSLQDLYVTTLRDVLLKDDVRARNLAITALYFVRPSAISREKREAVLDQLTDIILSDTRDVAAILSIIVQLMESSNATAKISSDGAIFFQIAEQLQKANLASTANLQLLQELVHSTLERIVSN